MKTWFWGQPLMLQMNKLLESFDIPDYLHASRYFSQPLAGRNIQVIIRH